MPCARIDGVDIFTHKPYGTPAGSACASVYRQSEIYNQCMTAGYQPMPRPHIQPHITNLFDRTYYRAVGYSKQWGTDIYGEPRKAKLTAKYSF